MVAAGRDGPVGGEVGQGYREVDDPSVVVRFRLADEPKVSLLAWTTTPWTLPSNVALAVSAEIIYAQHRRWTTRSSSSPRT